MTTLDMADLLISFFFGAAVCFCICMAVHHRHKKAWQAEYRRLMDGIEAARENVLDVNVTRASISEYLRKVYSDEIFWPRK